MTDTSPWRDIAVLQSATSPTDVTYDSNGSETEAEANHDAYSFCN
jgi:hypothetical protein